jgi:hypothetical protein
MRKCSVKLSMIHELVYEDDGLGRIVFVPTRSVWIKGTRVFSQHEEVLNLGVLGSL